MNAVENIGPGIQSAYAVLGQPGGNTEWLDNLSGGGGGIGWYATRDNAGGGAYEVIINGKTYNFKTHFANDTSFGVLYYEKYYIGGGGAGYFGGWNTNGVGGGGGRDGMVGVPNTGSGSSG